MKCNICDKELTEKEVVWNTDIDTFEPCTVCLDSIMDAAFSDGFARPDEDDVFVILGDSDYEDEATAKGWYAILKTYGSQKEEDDA